MTSVSGDIALRIDERLGVAEAAVAEAELVIVALEIHPEAASVNLRAHGAAGLSVRPGRRVHSRSRAPERGCRCTGSQHGGTGREEQAVTRHRDSSIILQLRIVRREVIDFP